MIVLTLAGAAAAQAQTETVLYSFACSGACDNGPETNPGPNGAFPATGVTLDSAGNLYGTAPGGSTQDGYYFGVVYKVDTSGHETVLYAFCSADLRPPVGRAPCAAAACHASGARSTGVDIPSSGARPRGE